MISKSTPATFVDYQLSTDLIELYFYAFFCHINMKHSHLGKFADIEVFQDLLDKLRVKSVI